MRIGSGGKGGEMGNLGKAEEEQTIPDIVS